MSVEVNLFCMSDEDSIPILTGPVNFKEKGTLRELREVIKDAGIVDWPYDFWYRDRNCRIKRKKEGLNYAAMEVYLIPVADELSQPSKRRRVEAVGDNLVPALCQTDKDVVGRDEGPDMVALADSSRVSCVVTGKREVHLKSVLVSKEIMDKYKEHEKKLRKELAVISLDDHMWYLLSWDNDRGVGYVQIVCEECPKTFGGYSGNHSDSAIRNLFASFKNSHLKSNTHIKSWCRRKGFSFTDHPQSVSTKPVILTAADHRNLVKEGLEIMKCVNDGVEEDGGQPFVSHGDLDAKNLCSFWFKVKCKLCGDFFQLCPPKKNLAKNLNNHLQLKHSKLVKQSTSGSAAAATYVIINPGSQESPNRNKKTVQKTSIVGSNAIPVAPMEPPVDFDGDPFETPDLGNPGFLNHLLL